MSLSRLVISPRPNYSELDVALKKAELLRKNSHSFERPFLSAMHEVAAVEERFLGRGSDNCVAGFHLIFRAVDSLAMDGESASTKMDRQSGFVDRCDFSSRIRHPVRKICAESGAWVSGFEHQAA